MIDTNELRMLVQDFKLAGSPMLIQTTQMNELLDRLEETKTAWKEADKACRDLTEKVIPNLRESLEAAEKERDAAELMSLALLVKIDNLQAEVIHIKEVEFPRKAQAVADGWRGKCERLEAKIAELEKQVEKQEPK